MMGLPHSRDSLLAQTILNSVLPSIPREWEVSTKCDAVREHEFSIALDYG